MNCVKEMFSTSIVSNEEEIYDVSILMGGLNDQSIHHDTPRLVAYDATKSKILFEINRKKYLNNMESSIAQSSILMDISEEKNGIKLGVLYDFVETNKDNTSCRIRNGKPDETFNFVRFGTDINEHKTCVIHDKDGFGIQFVGDFPHFGVCNTQSRLQKETMLSFVDILTQTNDISTFFSALTSLKNLDGLCRLFVKTRPKSSCKVSYALNAVGAIDFKTFDSDYGQLLIQNSSMNLTNPQPPEPTQLCVTNNHPSRQRRIILEQQSTEQNNQRLVRSSSKIVHDILYNVDVSWINRKNFGLQKKSNLKGFYFGNLLFVTKSAYYIRIIQLFHGLFKPPKEYNYSCSKCSQICRNYYEYNSHLTMEQCPQNFDDIRHPHMLPAFYVDSRIIPLLEKTYDVYIHYDSFLPMDVFNEESHYQVFLTDNIKIHPIEITLLIKQEIMWLEQNNDESLLVILQTKLFKDMENPNVYLPLLLAMPYLSKSKTERVIHNALTILTSKRTNIQNNPTTAKRFKQI